MRLLCGTVLRATFGVHRLPAALHLMHCLLGLRRTATPAASPAEWTFFLTGAAMGSAAAAAPGGAAAIPHWVPAAARERFASLLGSLPGVAQAARLDDSAAWSSWLAAAAPDSVPAVASALTRFQQVIVLQVCMPLAPPVRGPACVLVVAGTRMHCTYSRWRLAVHACM